MWITVCIGVRRFACPPDSCHLWRTRSVLTTLSLFRTLTLLVCVHGLCVLFPSVPVCVYV